MEEHSDGEFSTVQVNVRSVRCCGFYLLTLYIPTTLLMVIAYATFFFIIEDFNSCIVVALAALLVLTFLFTQVLLCLVRNTSSLLSAPVPCLQQTMHYLLSPLPPVPVPCSSPSCVSYQQSLLQTSNSLLKTSYFKVIDIWLFFSIVAILVEVMLQTPIDYSLGNP